MTDTIRRVTVVGSGSAVWLVASALRQAFRHHELDVLVVESTPAAPTPVGQWTLPSLRGLHGLIGVRESDLLRRTGATFKLASEHRDWQGPGTRYLHAHGDIGTSLNGMQFYKYLLLRALAGQRESTASYSLAATAAEAGRFARPMSTNALTSSFTYAFHLPEAAYAAYLREHAGKLGVRSMRGQVVSVRRAENDDVSAIVLQDGTRVDSELFVDCSGGLMNLIDDSPYENWGAWFPGDRMLSAPAAAAAAPPALTLTMAIDSGWLWMMPLAESTLVGHVYSSAFTSDSEAARQLTQATGCDQPVLTPLSAGRRRSSWIRNCVALGTAAVAVEPLTGANLHLNEIGVANLIELFPLRSPSTTEAVEFNRIMGNYADGLRDFALTHYRAGSGRTGEYWRAAREHAPPDSFAERMDQFRAGGRIAIHDNETFEETDWAWLLLGSGCAPDALELHARTHLAGVQPDAFASLQASIQRLVASMPRHIDFVRHQRQGAAS